MNADLNDRRVDPEEDANILADIDQGMRVYDINGSEIGAVTHVYFGFANEDADLIDRDAPDDVVPGVHQPEGGLGNAIEEAFYMDDALEESLRDRLWRQGFIRVEGSGISGEKEYITAGQIESVSGGSVRLKIAREELLEK